MHSDNGHSSLIILLSQDKVELRLWGGPDAAKVDVVSGFDVQGLFLHGQVAAGMDKTLEAHPALLDQFESVDVVVVDRPGVIIPHVYADEDTMAGLAGRYLRSRAGDQITSDQAPGQIRFAYCLPADTQQTLREYYANAGFLHLTSVLWSSLSVHDVFSETTVGSRLFFFMVNNTLIVLGQDGHQLTFARHYKLYGPGDLVYYAMACRRMLQPAACWQIHLEGERADFVMPFTTFFSFDRSLTLPSLHQLILRHRLCES